MAKMKPRAETSTVLFDVFYEDGSRASNRKVPANEIAGPEGDAAALTFIMGQERKIADLSGKPPREITRVVRSGRAR
jgi:hypothetical protein